MRSQSVVDAFQRTTDEWLAALDTYTPEDFVKKLPVEGEWNLQQVYGHIIEATESLAVPSIEKCLNDGRRPTEATMNVWGRIFFLLGSFPPIRIRFKPRPDYQPRAIATIQDARAGLLRARDKVNAASTRIAAADPARKSRHPAFGALNAAEWLQFAEMHLRHHLRQKRRVERALSLAR